MTMEYGDFQQGDLTEVTLVTAGSETSVDHLAGSTQLSVYDSGDFRDEGGFLKIFVEDADPDDPESEEISYLLSYSTKDDDTNIITLVDPLPVDIEEDTQVWLDPRTLEKWASVLLDNDVDAITARVPYALSLGVEEGIREEPEAVTVQLQGNDYVVVDFPGKEEIIDWEAIDPGTIPNPGEGPGPDEAPVLTGQPALRSVFLQWTEVPPNPTTGQQIFYEVHASVAADFEGGEGTLYSAQMGPICQVTSMPNGTDLSTEDPTYFKVRAFDRNGVGPWSNEVSATAIAGLDPAIIAQLQLDLQAAQDDIDELYDTTLPALDDDLSTLEGKFPVTSVDISDDAITSPKILAGAILSSHITVGTLNGDRIATNTLSAAKIIAGSITSDRFTSNTINGDIITANTLNASKIVAGTITSDRIATGAITADKIFAGSITADKLDANAVTGKVVRTASSGFRAELSPLGTYSHQLAFYSAGNAVVGRVFNDSTTIYLSGSSGTISIDTVGINLSPIFGPINLTSDVHISDTLSVSGDLDLHSNDLLNCGSLGMQGNLNTNGNNITGDPGFSQLTGSDGLSHFVTTGNSGKLNRGGTVSSDRKLKTEITELDIDPEQWLSITPYKFKPKAAPKEGFQPGFMRDEFENNPALDLFLGPEDQLLYTHMAVGQQVVLRKLWDDKKQLQLQVDDLTSRVAQLEGAN